MICACMETSRAETGSSQTRKEGFTARALAIPILCLCPPENSWGYREAASGGSPTTSRSSDTLSATRSSPMMTRPSPTISETVMRGLSDPKGSWKTICIFFL